MRGLEIAGATPRATLGRQHGWLLRSFWYRVAYPRNGADRLTRVLLGCVGMFFGFVSLAGPLARLVPPVVYWKDVIQMYLLSRAMLAGVDPFLPLPVLASRLLGPTPGYNIAAFFPHPTPHPPTLGLLAMPLALLDYQTAAEVWLGVELVLLVADIWLLGRIAGVQLSPFMMLALAVTSIAWDPVIQDLSWGQLDILLLALTASMVLSLRSGNELRAGVLLGLTVLVKPIFGPIFLLFALRKRWRILGASVVTIAIAYFIVGWVVGFGHLTEYFTRSLPETESYYKSATGNMSLWTLGWRLFGGTSGVFDHQMVVPPLFNVPQLTAITSVVVPAAVLMAVALPALRTRDEGAAVGAMICVSIVVSPIAWRHYFVLATIPAIQVGYLILRRKFPRRETLMALVALVILLTCDYWEERLTLATGPNPGMTIPVLLVLVPTAAVILVGVVLLRLDSPSGCSEIALRA